jgi:hemerythrin
MDKTCRLIGCRTIYSEEVPVMSLLMIWTPDLSVNVGKIDDQHKELFHRFGQVEDAIWDGRGKDEIGKIIDFMTEYTVFHFGEEEGIMKQHSYPGYPAQKEAHDYFTREVAGMKAKYDCGEITSNLVVEVIEKLGGWFKNHIKVMDKELGKYLQGKG